MFSLFHEGHTFCFWYISILAVRKGTSTDIAHFSGTMGFAVNVIYRFIIPSDWIENPETAVCFAQDKVLEVVMEKATSCGEEFCQTPSCEFDVSPY